MRTLLITLALAATIPHLANAEAPPHPATAAAISAVFVGNDSAQRAIDADMCGRDTWHELDGESLRQYGHMRDAYLAARTIDANAERDFCFAIGER